MGRALTIEVGENGPVGAGVTEEFQIKGKKRAFFNLRLSSAVRGRRVDGDEMIRRLGDRERKEHLSICQNE
jgi:hypothetical protein